MLAILAEEPMFSHLSMRHWVCTPKNLNKSPQLLPPSSPSSSAYTILRSSLCASPVVILVDKVIEAFCAKEIPTKIGLFWKDTHPNRTLLKRVLQKNGKVTEKASECLCAKEVPSKIVLFFKRDPQKVGYSFKRANVQSLFSVRNPVTKVMNSCFSIVPDPSASIANKNEWILPKYSQKSARSSSYMLSSQLTLEYI